MLNLEVEDRAPLQPIETSLPMKLLALDHLKAEPRQSSASDILTIVAHYAVFLVTAHLKDITDVFWHYFVQ